MKIIPYVCYLTLALRLKKVSVMCSLLQLSVRNNRKGPVSWNNEVCKMRQCSISAAAVRERLRVARILIAPHLYPTATDLPVLPLLNINMIAFLLKLGDNLQSAHNFQLLLVVFDVAYITEKIIVIPGYPVLQVKIKMPEVGAP